VRDIGCEIGHHAAAGFSIFRGKKKCENSRFFQKFSTRYTLGVKCLRLCVHFVYISSRSNPPPLLPLPWLPPPRRDAARRRHLDFFRFVLRFILRRQRRGDLKSEKRNLQKALLRFIRRRLRTKTTTTTTTTTEKKKRRINTKTRSRRRLWSFPTAIGCPVRGRIGRLSGCPAMRNRTPLARRRHRTRRTTRITITRERRRRRRRGERVVVVVVLVVGNSKRKRKRKIEATTTTGAPALRIRRLLRTAEAAAVITTTTTTTTTILRHRHRRAAERSWTFQFINRNRLYP